MIDDQQWIFDERKNMFGFDLDLLKVLSGTDCDETVSAGFDIIGTDGCHSYSWDICAYNDPEFDGMAASIPVICCYS